MHPRSRSGFLGQLNTDHHNHWDQVLILTSGTEGKVTASSRALHLLITSGSSWCVLRSSSTRDHPSWSHDFYPFLSRDSQWIVYKLTASVESLMMMQCCSRNGCMGQTTAVCPLKSELLWQNTRCKNCGDTNVAS